MRWALCDRLVSVGFCILPPQIHAHPNALLRYDCIATRPKWDKAQSWIIRKTISLKFTSTIKRRVFFSADFYVGFFSVRFAQIFELWKNVDLEIKAVAQGWMRVYRIEKKSKIHWWSNAWSKKSKYPAKTINDKDKQYIHLAGRQTLWFREQKVKTADYWKTSRARTKASLDLTCIFLTESGSCKWH